jgi:uncharacterized protein YggU (UPF0235/DUF167 family)
MRLFVTAKTGAREEKVEEKDSTHFVVAVKAQPIEGKANDAIVKALARHLKVPKSVLTLRSGATGKNKVFDVIE